MSLVDKDKHNAAAQEAFNALSSAFSMAKNDRLNDNKNSSDIAATVNNVVATVLTVYILYGPIQISAWVEHPFKMVEGGFEDLSKDRHGDLFNKVLALIKGLLNGSKVMKKVGNTWVKQQQHVSVFPR